MSEEPPDHGHIRTDNDFLIGTNGTNLAAMLPVHISSREQAFRTAAYIAIMGESLPSEDGGGIDRVTFEDVREAVLNT